MVRGGAFLLAVAVAASGALGAELGSRDRFTLSNLICKGTTSVLRALHELDLFVVGVALVDRVVAPPTGSDTSWTTLFHGNDVRQRAGCNDGLALFSFLNAVVDAADGVVVALLDEHPLALLVALTKDVVLIAVTLLVGTIGREKYARVWGLPIVRLHSLAYAVLKGTTVARVGHDPAFLWLRALPATCPDILSSTDVAILHNLAWL